MARMTGIEGDAIAARQPSPKPGRSNKNQRRRFRLDAQSIERLPGWIAGRSSAGAGDSEPDKPRAPLETAPEFDERGGAALGLEMHPVADDHVGIGLLGHKAVVVNRMRLLDRQIFGEAEIEDHTHPSIAKILGHLGFGAKSRLGSPGAFLLRELCLSLQGIATPRAPMRVDVDSLQTVLRAHSGRILSSTMSRSGPFWTLPVRRL